MLATGGPRRVTRLWIPADDRCIVTVPVHHAASLGGDTAWPALMANTGQILMRRQPHGVADDKPSAQTLSGLLHVAVGIQ